MDTSNGSTTLSDEFCMIEKSQIEKMETVKNY